MLKITSTRPITWPGLALLTGENEFPSRKSVPAELWPKLARFRELGLVAFDVELGKNGLPVGDDKVVLAELTERQLFDMGKDELAALAKAEGLAVPEGAKKAQLLEAMVPKAKPLPKLDEAPAEGDKAGVTVDPTGGGKAVPANRRARTVDNAVDVG